MSTQVISLVSIGAHPTSGRPRRAEQDARAVELGLQLAGNDLQVLHAGDVAEPALRAYLGMGLQQLHVLEQPQGADGLPLLCDYLQGIGACDKVVAINLDPGCDMIKRADLSVIGDSAAILQALIAAVEAYRNGAKRDAA